MAVEFLGSPQYIRNNGQKRFRMALRDKQRAFVDEYLIDLNATQAAIRAGYSQKTAGIQGFDLLKKPEIQAQIAERQRDREIRTEITQDRVLQEIARVAFFDPRKLFNADGSPKRMVDLDDESAAVVAGLDVATIGNAEVGVGQIMKYKIADKMKALDQCMSHLGLGKTKVELSGKVELPAEALDAKILDLIEKLGAK